LDLASIAMAVSVVWVKYAAGVDDAPHGISNCSFLYRYLANHEQERGMFSPSPLF